MVFLILFLFILLILLIIPLKIEFYYEFTDYSKYKVTVSYLFGLIKKEIDSTKKEKESKKSKSGLKKIDAYDLLRYFIDKGQTKKIYLNIIIGIKDPFLLGIVTGIIWSISCLIYSFILKDKYINEIDNKYIMVTPKFNEDMFQIFFLCIIKVNLVYIIIIYIRYMKKRKGGGIFARASNRRLNENYNG
ncbi:MAG TPA: DUF2953 domain-containing protein [Tissierellaceae bacterium]